MTGDDLHDLLVGAVPPAVAPADRLARVARLVRRRRRIRTATGTALAGVAVLGGVLLAGNRPGPPEISPAIPAAPATSSPVPTAGRATAQTSPPPPPSPTGAAPGTRPVTSTAAPTAQARPTSSVRSRTGVVGLEYDRALVPAPKAGSAAERVARTDQRPGTADIGIFRTVCEYARLAPDDPLRAPGRPGAAPLQLFWGNTAAGAASTADSVRARGNSTCRGGVLDRSAYWAPALIDTANGRPLAPSLVHVFYGSGYLGIKASQVAPMPAGLRMLVDEPLEPASTGLRFAGWQCSSGGDGAPSRAPADCGAGSELAMVVQFPQCWDGRNLDSPDHRSHVAHPVDGRCPAAHPVALPQLSYHVVYPVRSGDDPGRWRLSTSTSSPGRIQAGWMDGWQPAAARAWGLECVRAQRDCFSHLLGDGRAISGDV